MADSFVVCIEIKCDFFAARARGRTLRAYWGFIYFHSTLPSFSDSFYAPLHAFQLDARPVWQPFVAHCANQK